MIIEKTNENTYKVYQDEDIENKVNDIFSLIYGNSEDKLNVYVAHLKKKNLFVDLLVDEFVSKVSFDGKVNISTVGGYDVNIFIMISSDENIKGINYSFE